MWAVRPSAASARAVSPPSEWVPVFQVSATKQPGWRSVEPLVALSDPLVADLCTGRVVAFGSRPEAKASRVGRVQAAPFVKVGAPWHRPKVRSCRTGLTETANFQTPVRQSRALAALGAEPRYARPSRSGWRVSVGCPSAPNHSVKGTSCGRPQAAPYLER